MKNGICVWMVLVLAFWAFTPAGVAATQPDLRSEVENIKGSLSRDVTPPVKRDLFYDLRSSMNDLRRSLHNLKSDIDRHFQNASSDFRRRTGSMSADLRRSLRTPLQSHTAHDIQSIRRNLRQDLHPSNRNF